MSISVNRPSRDFDAWARQSNQIAREFVYPGISTDDSRKYCRLGEVYVTRSRAIARAQLALAGHRLAALLNATLGADTPPPVPQPWPPGPR